MSQRYVDSRRPLLLVSLATLLLVLAGCTPAGTDSDGSTTSPVPEGELGIAVVGDSITVGNSSEFAPGQVSEDSWVSHAVGENIRLAGGWAQWGATTQQMADAVTPVDADVLVIMAGTNDIGLGVSTAEVEANLESIVETIGAEAVLLCAVPPLDHAPAEAAAFNEFLHQVATSHDWHWVDAAADVRSGDRYAPGMSVDGVHPSEEGAQQIGAKVGAALRAEFATGE